MELCRRFRILKQLFLPKNCPSLRSGQFGGQESLGPLKIVDYVFCPHKKITSRTIRNRGAFIVNMNSRSVLCFYLHPLSLNGTHRSESGLNHELINTFVEKIVFHLQKQAKLEFYFLQTRGSHIFLLTVVQIKKALIFIFLIDKEHEINRM
jgi:hypothetical protein